MKNTTLLLLFALLLATCKKDSLFDEYGYYGEARAKLNGVPWTGNPSIFFPALLCRPDSCIAIDILQFNKRGELRSDITIDDVPMRLGRQTLNPGWDVLCSLSYSEFADDGCVLTGIYSVSGQSDDNYVDITQLDLKTGDISGKFQATVVREEFWTPRGYEPDTIRITEGTFRGRIKKR